MAYRITADTERAPALEFSFDGRQIIAYPGETIAAALLANDIRGFRCDTRGLPRGPYCNMGTCFECMVEVRGMAMPASAGDEPARDWQRVRACITLVASGAHVRTALTARGSDEPR